MPPEAYYAFFRDAVSHRPPGSEPLDAFYARVREGLLAVVDEHAEGHVLLVCHLGVMRAAIAPALETSLSALYACTRPTRAASGCAAPSVASSSGLAEDGSTSPEGHVAPARARTPRSSRGGRGHRRRRARTRADTPGPLRAPACRYLPSGVEGPGGSSLAARCVPIRARR
jgi:hypothetical protein